MNSLTAQSPSAVVAPKHLPGQVRRVFKLLRHLRHGALIIHTPSGDTVVAGDGHGQQVSISLKNWNVCTQALRCGDIGFAETYIAGDWSTNDLSGLLKLFIANRKTLDAVIYGTWAGRLLYRIKHLLNRNTRTNSRKNVHAHYDLGNAFYRLWLDGSMNYSSALFEGDLSSDMCQAQHAKVRRALRMAGVQPGHRVLEIGCGWGALAEKATAEFGAHITGVTLSTEQLAYAQQRLAQAGMADQSDFRLQDYRDISDAPFDAICSIEMVEAVGKEYWPAYFETVAKLLKPGGRVCIQSITIHDDHFERYLKSTDFIQQYIFPGGCLPSPKAFRQAARDAGLQVVDELAFGPDYAETCRRWRHDFLNRRDDVLTLGFDERFIRIWEFYLAYCEAGFDSGDIDVVQFTLAK